MRTCFIIFIGLLLCAPVSAYADYGDGLYQYLHGHYDKAINEFKPLAQEGNPKAQYILGSMYANGQGVLQDYVQAHAWLNLAAAQGHEKASLYRNEIAQKMNSNQVAQAQQLATQFQSQAEKQETQKTDKELIVSIQNHLQNLGYYSGAIDGVMGQNTSRSIRQFQRDADLPVTGQPSSSLVSKLKQADSQQEADQRKEAKQQQDPWTQVLLHDEFADANFTSNPEWIQTAGTFWVDSNYFLRTKRDVPEAQKQADQQASQEQRVTEVFGQVVKELMNPQQGEQTQSIPELYTKLKLGNAFALHIDIQMFSDKRGQSFELKTYQGQDRSSGYALRFLNQKEQSLALIRFSQSGSSVIDVIRQDKLINANHFQSISWLRHKDGEMRVLINDKEVLSTQDNMFRGFDGLSLINLGGDYAVRSIRVLGSDT
ncbi:MAG: peptidoglycan-binding protein [Desulfovermiculus sp.]